jgi:CRP/FNR family transcriptional regulator, cyclic AMP receptor protein
MKHMNLLEYQSAIVDKSPNHLLNERWEPIPQLQKTSFLSNVPEEILAVLLGKSKKQTYPKNALIALEGDEPQSFFIILSGRVRVFSECDRSKEITFNIWESGSCFGEIALLTSKPRCVSVIALEKTVCSIIYKTDFLNWLMTYPDVAIYLLGAISEEIIQLTDKVRQMALLNVYERTINVLKNLTVNDGNVSVIHNRPSLYILASMVGASREMVSKIMRDLTKGGYIEITNNTLVIKRNLPSSW